MGCVGFVWLTDFHSLFVNRQKGEKREFTKKGSYNSTSLLDKTTMLDDFELWGEDEMEPTSSVTFQRHYVLREVWDMHRRAGEHLCL